MEGIRGQIRMERRARRNETETSRTARDRERQRGRGRERERKYNQCINKLSRALPNVRARSGYIQVPPTCAFHFQPSSQHPVFPHPPPLCSMLRRGVAILHGGAASMCSMLRGGAASQCATLRGGAASLCIMLRGGAAALCSTLRRRPASLCTTLRRGAASLGAALSLGRRGMIPSTSHDGGVVPSSGATLCKCMKPLSSHDEGALPSSHDGGAVLSSVSFGSARVRALYARSAEVVIVVGVAVGAVTGVARCAGWGLWWGSLCGSSCGVVSSLAPCAES